LMHVTDTSIYADKILVDLDQCEVMSSDYTTQPFSPSLTSPMSTVMNPDVYSHDPYLNTVQSTYLTYVYEGKKYVGGPVKKGEIAARVLMMEKKTTYIYYNRSNPDKYYFDLRFMNEG
jgi:hypothetical protein